jgi:hypothetical protein
MLPRITFPLLFVLLTPSLSAVAAPDWATGVPARAVQSGAQTEATRVMEPYSWERIDGCARSIAARAVNQVVVVGCDGAGAAGSVFFWRAQGSGGRWEAEPAGTKMHRWDFNNITQQFAIPATASWLAISGEAPPQGLAGVGGVVYAIGSDALLYARPIELAPVGASSWSQFAGTTHGRSNLKVTAVAAGGSNGDDRLWMISAEPNGPGGNKIHVAEPCRKENDLASGRCWRDAGGAAQKIAVGREVWVVSADGGIFRRDGQAWTRIDGCARDIAANGGHLYVVGCDWSQGEATVYRRAGNVWKSTSQKAKTLAVDAAGTPWLVRADGRIFRRATASAGASLGVIR